MSRNSLIQHEAWIGGDFERTGLDGQKIAIVGYSHWNGELGCLDYSEFTRDVIQGVMRGDTRHNFFTQIRNYFDFSSHEQFWNKVAFFNYLPRCIGGPEARFDAGTADEHREAKDRLFRLAHKLQPQKLIVFSAKTWGCRYLPPFDEGNLHFRTVGIEDAVLKSPCGLYRSEDYNFAAFGLRHPQGAPGDQMSEAVRRIRAIPFPGVAVEPPDTE